MKLVMNIQLKKRENGIYYVVIRDDKGRRHWKSLQTSVKTEATFLFNKYKDAYLEAKIKTFETKTVHGISLKDFVNEFLKHIQSTKEYNTYEAYLFILKDFLKFINGDITINKIVRKNIDEYIYYCKNILHNKHITINKKLRHLKSFFNKAIEWEYIKNNPISTKQYLKVDKLPPRCLTSEEINKLLLSIDDVKFKVFVYMAILTGCRRNELLNLTWDDIDFNKRTITIRKAKSHYSRYVPISDELYNILYPIRGIGKIFPWAPDFTSEKFRNYARKAGIKCRLHDLRHSFATHLLNSCGNIKIVQDLLGHRDIQSTMVYAHSISELNRIAINNLKFT